MVYGREVADMHMRWEIFVAEYEASDSDENLSSEEAEHHRFFPQSAYCLKRSVALRQSLRLLRLDILAIFRTSSRVWVMRGRMYRGQIS